jgi:hypothetical protein
LRLDGLGVWNDVVSHGGLPQPSSKGSRPFLSPGPRSRVSFAATTCSCVYILGQAAMG